MWVWSEDRSGDGARVGVQRPLAKRWAGQGWGLSSSVNQRPQCLLPEVLEGAGRGGMLGLTISMPFFFMRRQDLRYVRMRLRARSWNSGNCRLHDSMMAWIFSLGCLEMGTMRSRFSSTKRRTNICGGHGRWAGLARCAPAPAAPGGHSR